MRLQRTPALDPRVLTRIGGGPPLHVSRHSRPLGIQKTPQQVEAHDPSGAPHVPRQILTRAVHVVVPAAEVLWRRPVRITIPCLRSRTKDFALRQLKHGVVHADPNLLER